MRRLAIIAALFVGAAVMAARPGTEYQLFINLNGEERRWTLPDGGQSGLYGLTGAATCMQVRNLDGGLFGQIPAAANNVIEIVPLVPINLCERNIKAAWDGGCGTSTTDINFGVPLQPLVPKYAVLQDSTTHLCASSDAGSVNASVFSLQ